MNWRKGLVRLWIAVSLLWIIFFSIHRLSDSINLPTFAEPPQQGQDTTQFVALVIGPPVAMLVFGFGIWWIVDGFRDEPHRRKNKSYNRYTDHS
jgi:hypothetical protein